MPQLGNRTSVKIILPASTKSNKGEECWVECYEDPVVSDYMISQKTNEMAASVEVLTKLIKDWNFDDGAGHKAEITYDNVKMLPLEDIAVIANALQLEEKMKAKLDTAKKNSFSSSSEPKSPESSTFQDPQV